MTTSSYKISFDVQTWQTLDRDDNYKNVNLKKILGKGTCQSAFIRKDLLTDQGESTLWTIECPREIYKHNLLLQSSSTKSHQKITLIYFVNCRVSPHYKIIMEKHFDDINASNAPLDPNFRVIIVAAGKAEDAKTIHEIVQNKAPKLLNSKDPSNLANSIDERLEIRICETSPYEYQGIHTLWKESLSHSKNEFIIYAHCKGISYLSASKKNIPVQSLIASQAILRNLYKNISIMDAFPFLNKCGLFQGGAPHNQRGRKGWMFWNFYICRSRYIQQLEEPKVSSNRFYYEFWLGQPSQAQTNPEKLKYFHDGISMLTQPYPTIANRIEAKEIGKYVNDHRAEIMQALTACQKQLHDDFRRYNKTIYSNELLKLSARKQEVNHELN